MIRISWLLVSYLAASMVIRAGPDQPEQAIDTERSFLTVHVGKEGLLSAAAHEHWVNAPIAGGTIAAEGSTPAVRFTVDARRLSVRPEKGVTDKGRARFTRRPNHRPDLRRRNKPPDQHHLRHTCLQAHSRRRQHVRVLRIKGRSTDGAAHLVLPR